jgi:hypothetical protein
MVLGVKVLAIVGRLGVMESESAAVHVPDSQPTAVFVTPDGTEMNAVFVTCVWARAGKANIAIDNASRQPSANALANRSLSNEKIRRPSTFFLIFTIKYSFI